MERLDVTLAADRYRILVDPGLLDRLGEVVADLVPHARAALLVDARIADTHGARGRAALEAGGFTVLRHELAAREDAKTLEVVARAYDALLDFRMERGSPVVALGGGIVGDVAGYVASTYLRGVPFIQAPTTLLAMVDASIGGKTGVNLPLPAGAFGKNLVGTFWQPRVVVIDPTVLATLDDRDFRCGLAECVKHGVIADPPLLAFMESSVERIADRDPDTITELITRSARVKVAIVESDEREQGRRAVLNLGHTFAHAIEPRAVLDLRHGEAVAVGLSAAASCAVALGRLDPQEALRITTLLERLGLPTRLPRSVPVGALVQAMAYDKKVTGDRLRVVLPTRVGHVEIVDDAPDDAVVSAWGAVGASPGRGREGD